MVKKSLLVNGAQGRDRTTDTVIFSHVLYQLSYLGPPFGGCIARSPPRGAGSLTFAFSAVHPGGVYRRAGDAIALTKPFQEVAALAAAAAEWRMLLDLRLAAERAGFGLRLARHVRPKWLARGLAASSPRPRFVVPVHSTNR